MAVIAPKRSLVATMAHSSSPFALATKCQSKGFPSEFEHDAVIKDTFSTASLAIKLEDAIMNQKNIFLFITITIILTACATSGGPQAINLIPMYGYPNIEKTAAQKEADERFIKEVSVSEGSRKNASKAFAWEGWKFLNNGDKATAMRRFNQSWLLDPDYYHPYWGFGKLLLFEEGKLDESVKYLKKALSLIDKDGGEEKERLLATAASGYILQANIAASTDKVKSIYLFRKSTSLLNEAIKLNPSYGLAYRHLVVSSYGEGNYENAWDMVKKLRSMGGGDLPSSNFIDMLTKKMPEPE
jgi:hypothetical protein